MRSPASYALLYPLCQDKAMAGDDQYTAAFAASPNGIAANTEDTMWHDLHKVVEHHDEARQAGAASASPAAMPPATPRGTQARTPPLAPAARPLKCALGAQHAHTSLRRRASLGFIP